MDLLIHGIYDTSTLKTLRLNGIKKLGFDLRGRSSNLIPFYALVELFKELNEERVFLTFENDKETTVLSFLNLLEKVSYPFTLEFRGQESAQYLRKVGHPFFWFFYPEGNWEEILSLENCQGIILPIEWKSFYQKNLRLWELIEFKGLEVFLHVHSLESIGMFSDEKNLAMSVDLSREDEVSFRRIDQERLVKLLKWRRSYEDIAGQR